MKSKKGIILIILIAILLIGGGCYLYFNSNVVNSNKPVKEQEHQKIEIEDFIKTYDEKIFPKMTNYDYILGTEYPIKDIDSITSKEKTLVLLQDLHATKNEISTEDAESIKNKYFLNAKLYTKTIKNNGIVAYKYKNDKYYYKMPYSNVNTLALNTDFDEVYTDYVVISQKLLFVETSVDKDSETVKNIGYKDYQTKEKVYEVNGDFSIDEKTETELLDKLDTYHYRFEKYDGEYILVSVTKKWW